MSTPKVPAYLVTASGNVTVSFGSRMYTIGKDHANYKAILGRLKEKRWKGLEKLFNVTQTIEKRSKGTLKVSKGAITYGGKPVANVVVDRIFLFMQQGFDFKPLVNFLRRLLENESENSVNQLYKFMEANNLPITHDGYILAYKKVRDDFKDFYSGRFDNSPGKTVKMPRSAVADNPDVTCSYGLHVGSLEYARDNFNAGSGKVVLVKVDPKNVVSVPNDYNGAKCRTCEYTVVEEYKDVQNAVTQANCVRSR